MCVGSLSVPVSTRRTLLMITAGQFISPDSHEVSMASGSGSELSDGEISGYMNDVVILMSGFLLTVFLAFLLVELLIGPVLASVVPAFSGSIIDCVWTGTESVCSGGLKARGLLVVAVGLPLTILWLNNYQDRIRPYLAARGIVPGNNQ